MKLFEIKHTYYCENENYFSNECCSKYFSWDDFYKEHHTDDIDLNLIFRWDWLDSDDALNEIDHDELHLFVIKQRKGIFNSYVIRVKKDEEPLIKGFLKPYAEKMKELWCGI